MLKYVSQQILRPANTTFKVVPLREKLDETRDEKIGNGRALCSAVKKIQRRILRGESAGVCVHLRIGVRREYIIGKYLSVL